MAVEITFIGTINSTPQEYNPQDTALISSTVNFPTLFDQNSYIELFISDLNNNILTSDLQFNKYKVINNGKYIENEKSLSSIQLDVENVLSFYGYSQGEYIISFNFYSKHIGSSLQKLYISEISSDRTELRLDSTELAFLDIVESTNNFVQERDQSSYFVDFYLNFGDNKLVLANNIELDDSDINNPTILVKLYNPLPTNFNVNSTLWIVTTLIDLNTTNYRASYPIEPIVFNDTISISGPNFNLDLKDQVNNSTLELSYFDILNTSLSSSTNQINSLLEEKEIDINIDYTDFSNFIHFSSAKTRLENFYYKVGLIQEYSSSLSLLNSVVSSSNDTSSSKAIYESKINQIITNFDGYDYYLYYSSGSYSWPKTNLEPPYQLYPSTSPVVLNWIGSDDESSPYYGGLLLSASKYDYNNPNYLFFSIPEYLRNDPSNENYQLFIDMVGQHYDNIWVYYKDVTNKYNADNRLEYGISKDIVADAIRDFGIKLYQNNFSNEDLYTAFLGLTPEGGLFPFPNITGSLPTPSGFEYIENFISASSDYMPLDDVNKSLYKRIYHNLPYLLKSKGTLPGLRALITSYGIPDTILRINEYGGKDKTNSNDWDYWQDEFNYALYSTGSSSINTLWGLNLDWNAPDNVPSTLMFRFKTEGLPQTNIPYSQSLWCLDPSPSNITLTYTGSGYASSSYSGSIIDPYYQYATLTFYPDSVNYPNSTASIYLPFFDGGWWSVMVTRNNNDFTLSSGNKIYEGGDNNTILGFYSTSSINEDPSLTWLDTSNNSVFFRSSTILSNTYDNFSGSLQEIRYYTNPISESVFKDYIMNPSSIEGNSLNSSPNELAFRVPLGGELYTGSISIHPKITGSWVTTSSFISDSNLYFNSTPTFISNKEYFFYDQPIAGIKNTISDKIRIENNVIPEGDTLSPFMSLSQMANVSQSYTQNINYLEVAFSPQNEINEDIMDQIGSFNIGEYIGDPRLRSSSAVTYPALDTLRNEYFQKYTKNYNLTDFIRLIKFFDNSLFKMIRDFVPARTSLASGVVIKQHLLERNKYPQPQLEWENITYSGTLKPQWNNYQPGTVENFEGGTGGLFEMFNTSTNISQSWIEDITTPSGSVLVLHNTQDEFYNGEFSGSAILVSNGVLNEAYPINNQVFEYKQVHYYGTSSVEDTIFENNFLNNITSPKNGEILFFNKATFIPIPAPPFSLTFYETKYLKVAKIDCNGNDHSLPLGEITKMLIYNPIVGTYVPYTVTNINELPSYYLYEAGLFEGYLPSYPNQVLDYTVSASITNPYTFSSPTSSIYFQPTESIDILNLYDSSSGLITFNNTPNTPIIITASILLSTNNSPQFGSFSLRKGNNPSTPGANIGINSNITVTNVPTTFIISGTLYPIEGDSYYLKYTLGTGGSPFINTIGNLQLLVTQSRAVSASNCENVLFEPYITTANFYNSDENALLNNAFELRDSSYYMDVDYSKGATEPVNFNQLISGSATRAKVQDSNYTSKRVTLPRYEGSRSTSQFLNKWTKGDSGTFGKSPSVESTKTAIAYCDWIGGWPPEKMNASTAHILYLIHPDGTVSIPNISENSLYNTQGNFVSGERFTIQTKDSNSGDPVQYRTIIRGGSRIEPILYTQSGSSPGAQWNTTMSFEDIVPSDTGNVGNYTALYSTPQSSPIPSPPAQSWTKVPLIITNYGVPVSNNEYTVVANTLTDGVNLLVKTKYTINIPGSSGFPVYGRIVKQRGTNKTYYPDQFGEGQYYSAGNFSYTNQGIDFIEIPTSDLEAGDTIYVEIYSEGSNLNLRIPRLWISQYPAFTQPITSSGINSIWGYADTTNYPYVITSSNQTLVELYDSGVKQSDITGSGFNPIALPWSIKYGDEFRFEGREDFTFTVGKIFEPEYSGSDRITQTGSIEVHFDKNLPVSASSSVFNLDHFLIRRYVDDASQILFEGFRPPNSVGPYIIKSEYVNSELNKNIDQIILDLTQKGLL